nr:chalcone isomerase family protein [Dechloromonas sp.]
MIKSTTVRRVALIASLLALPGVHAAEVAGVRLDDSLRVGSNELVLNGAGVRSKLFIKVYVGALYVGEKSSSPTAIIGSAAPRRMLMRLQREVGADALRGCSRSIACRKLRHEKEIPQ